MKSAFDSNWLGLSPRLNVAAAAVKQEPQQPQQQEQSAGDGKNVPKKPAQIDWRTLKPGEPGRRVIG